MDVMPEGREIEVSPVQLSNALLLMIVTPAGTVNDEKPVQ